MASPSTHNNVYLEGLITTIAGPSIADDARRLKQLRDATARALRNHQEERTNQFAVQDSLEGLEEKFTVLNRDDLASALHERLKVLPRFSSKWTPEILSLFLSLSDRPAQKSRVEDLELLKRPGTPPPLTWPEIVADDPLDEEGVWDRVDFRGGSSDEDELITDEDEEEVTQSTPPSSHGDEDLYDLSAAYVEQPDKSMLDSIEKSGAWREANPPDQTIAISELQAVRESLFMLSGLPTSLFDIEARTGRIILRRGLHLDHAAHLTFADTLSHIAKTGSALSALRLWTQKDQTVPVLRTLQASVYQQLSAFNKALANIQQRLASPKDPTTVSLIDTRTEVEEASGPLLQLVAVVLSCLPSSHPFAYLESLYAQACLSSNTGNSESFRFLAITLFECLHTYLRPVREWMEEGAINSDDHVFFIKTEETDSPLAMLWHDRYSLRSSDGHLYAPRFLQPAAKRILNSGKSVIFLKALGQRTYTADQDKVEEPILDLDHVCGEDHANLLLPFSELFNTAFENWIQSKYTHASNILRRSLFENCGLWKVVDTLELVYLSRNAFLFETFAESLFERMDSRRRGWNDRFLLAEMAQSIFSNCDCLEPGALTMSMPSGKGRPETKRSVELLANVKVEYQMSWPVANVIRGKSLATYQSILILLLQIYRARHQLDRVNSRSLRRFPSSRTFVALRHCLVWFSNVLQHHLVVTVLATATAQMRGQLGSAEDIDAMTAVHERYIEKLQSQCLLTKNLEKIREAIISILDLGVLLGQVVTQQLTPTTTKQRVQRSESKSDDFDDPPDASDDEKDEEQDDGSDVEQLEINVSEANHSPATMWKQFHRLIGFVTSGLRAVGRAGGEETFEMLVESLEGPGKERVRDS